MTKVERQASVPIQVGKAVRLESTAEGERSAKQMVVDKVDQPQVVAETGGIGLIETKVRLRLQAE